jgi:hypothetical protein
VGGSGVRGTLSSSGGFLLSCGICWTTGSTFDLPLLFCPALRLIFVSGFTNSVSPWKLRNPLMPNPVSISTVLFHQNAKAATAESNARRQLECLQLGSIHTSADAKDDVASANRGAGAPPAGIEPPLTA